MGLDPIRTTEEIDHSYRRYLLTTFPIKDSELTRQFKEQLAQPDRFIKGPILEATPPFQTGKTIRALIKEGVLSPRFTALASEDFPLERHLYQHQEQAIRKATTDQRNIVIATGTGSGKTESFLIPVLDHLFRQEGEGALTPGVRALLLYPMNALANDQLKRLRKILKNYPLITFGRYTGETKEKRREAESHFRENFPQEPRIPNELLSREEMREAPPHILLTNYAMLEYLLLRPADCEFFDGEKARHWRFIVVDEAHTYDGAKGIEMALLLRRLKDRVVQSERGRIQCIATSATLGRGREDFPRVARFASELFGETFEWEEQNMSRQDVVAAVRLKLHSADLVWGVPTPEPYIDWQQEISRGDKNLLQRFKDIGLKHGVPEAILDTAETVANRSEKTLSYFLYEVLRGDARLQQLREYLEEKPQRFNVVAKRIFRNLDETNAQKVTTALVNLAVQAKPANESLSLLPARYHLFVRALEGAYIALAPERQLFLERTITSEGYPVFEMATCRRCGAIYLVGEQRAEQGRSFLRQSTSISEENREKVDFYLLCSPETQEEVLDNEDELVAIGEESPEVGDRYVLCARCGAIAREGSSSELCSCSSLSLVRLQKAPDRQMKRCLACRVAGPNTVGRFLTGQDAPVSVLTTTLYQQIPLKATTIPVTQQTVEEEEEEQDEWETPSASYSPSSPQSVNTRQLLLFSDSRQDAAFFACYLNRTYSQILRRRLILKTLEKHADAVLANRWRVQDLVEPLRCEAIALKIFPKTLSSQEQINEVWKWLLLELMADDRRNSLEGLGCLGFTLVRPREWRAPTHLTKRPWNLSETEVWALYQILLDSFRLQRALAFPDQVSPDDEIFAPRNREYYFRENGSSSRKHIFSWSSPGKGKLNRRLDFLLRLSKNIAGQELSIAQCQEVLHGVWKTLGLHQENSIWKDYFSVSNIEGEGVVYRLYYNFWELRPGIVDPHVKWYRCNVCGNVTLHNLKGVCPIYRCNGFLEPCAPSEALRDNHYRQLYLSLIPMPLVAEEHTAQLSNEAAAKLQERFARGEVNVLSCSTTFELGVDVGELETVLMRNVPPSTANYVQRAGRAGRRTETTAFALTFAQRKSHDLTHFAEPEQMIFGEIHPPRIEIRNEKIVRRHIHALALADFWRERPDLFGTVESFFLPLEKSGPETFAQFLEQRPISLQAALQRVVPEPLQHALGIQDWAWLTGLFDENDGVLKTAAEEIRGDIQALEKRRQELIEQRKPSDHILRVINNLKSRSIIDFLASHNVLPKYGFPVDVVELQILHHGEEAKKLDLARDLRVALSEYAPESEVVAGGKLWKSYGLKRLPNREWRKYHYAICQQCQRYQRVLADTGQMLHICAACGSPLEGRKVRGTFVIPEFGFVTSSSTSPRRPGEARPQRTYTTRVYFAGDASIEESQTVLELGPIRLVAKAARNDRLAVINRAGFRICHQCGFATLSESTSSHKTPLGQDCRGTLLFEGLGHEFQTDILDLRFEGYSNPDRAFWLSLLYTLLEGASESLHVSRDDLDGCLYTYSENLAQPALILFDNVPGGAGHVQRLVEGSEELEKLLTASKHRIDGHCGCALETSCYGCLRNYRNQFCHDDLKRGIVLEFLKSIGV